MVIQFSFRVHPKQLCRFRPLSLCTYPVIVLISHAQYIGGLAQLEELLQVPGSPLVVVCCRFFTKERMSLSYRARALDASSTGVPAEDALRLVHPAQLVSALIRAHDAFSPKAAHDALQFVDMT